MLSNKLESRDAYDFWLATDIVPTNMIFNLLLAGDPIDCLAYFPHFALLIRGNVLLFCSGQELNGTTCSTPSLSPEDLDHHRLTELSPSSSSF